MKKRPGQGVNRDRLLKATERLLLTQGFAATSIDMVCAKAGVTKGTFFHYFKTKEALAKATLERFGSKRHAQIHERVAREQPDDPLQRAYLIIDALGDIALADPKIGCVVAVFAQEIAETNPALRLQCAKLLAGWLEELHDALSMAKAKYAPRSVVDTAAIADHCFVVFEGALLLARLRKDRTVVLTHLTQYRDYLGALFRHPENATK